MRVRTMGKGDIVTVLDVPDAVTTTFTCVIPESVDVFTQVLEPPSYAPVVKCSGSYIGQLGVDYTVGPWVYLGLTGAGYLYSAGVYHRLSSDYGNIPLGFRKFLDTAPLSSSSTTRVPVVSERDSIVMHDVVTPSYKKDSALGRVIMSPMQRFSTYMELQPTVKRTKNLLAGYDMPNQGRYTVRMSTGSQPVAVGCPSAEMPQLPNYDPAVAEAFAKLQKADLDVAMMAAEGKETLEYIRVLCLRALKLYGFFASPKTIMKVAPRTYAKLKKKFRDKPIQWSSQSLAEAWLELRYALRPLLMDIENLVLFLLDPKKKKQDRQTFRRRENSVGAPEKIDSYLGLQGEFIRMIDFDISAGVLAELKVDPGSVDFGFTSWASVIWEKIPFSFVLDWIINISGLLYLLNPNCTWKVLGAWVTVSVSETVTGYVSSTRPDGSSFMTPFRSRLERKERIVDIKRPPIISLNVDLDTFKLLDLAALARGIKWGHPTLRL